MEVTDEDGVVLTNSLRAISEPTPRQSSVVLVEPHQLCRAALSAAINSNGTNLRTVAEADSPREGAAFLARFRADLMLISVEKLDDVAAITAAQRVSPHTRVVVLLMTDDGELVYESVRAGVSGCVPKTADPAEILAALSEVAAGKQSFHPAVTQAGLIWATAQRRESATDPIGDLTTREREVCELMAEGLSTKMIASRLFLSRRTVEFHLSSIYRKLGVRGRIEALRVYQRSVGS